METIPPWGGTSPPRFEPVGTAATPPTLGFPSPGSSALEYVGDDSLTIWGGFVGSPAHFNGKFSQNGNAGPGRWAWPGGGYEATMTRVNNRQPRAPGNGRRSVCRNG